MRIVVAWAVIGFCLLTHANADDSKVTTDELDVLALIEIGWITIPPPPEQASAS